MGSLKIFLFIFIVLPLILLLASLLTSFIFGFPLLGLVTGSYFGFLFGLVLILPPIAIGVFGFWLWMLVDLLQLDNFQDKLLWAVVFLLIPVLGAILYYFIVYSKQSRKQTQAPAAKK